MKFLKTTCIATALLLLLALGVSAQDIDKAKLEEPTATNSIGLRPVATPFSLLDISRIKWSNSYSVSFFSGNGQSGSLGLANTSMFYEFNDALSLQVNIGLLHSPGALWGDNRNNDVSVLPGFSLDYHPSDNFRMSIDFQKIDGRMYPYSFSPYSRWAPLGYR